MYTHCISADRDNIWTCRWCIEQSIDELPVRSVSTSSSLGSKPKRRDWIFVNPPVGRVRGEVQYLADDFFAVLVTQDSRVLSNRIRRQMRNAAKAMVNRKLARWIQYG